MKIAVLGAGAWGTALACAAAGRHEVLLWARDAAQARSMRESRANARYLPGVALPTALQITADEAAAHAHGRASVPHGGGGPQRGQILTIPGFMSLHSTSMVCPQAASWTVVVPMQS